MKHLRNFSLTRWLSLALVAAGVLLLVFQLVVFSRLRSSFSPGSKIAGVDVSGLDIDQAADRLTQAYSVPVELHYGDSSFQVKPATLGFSLDLSSMMAAADQARASLPFWSAFWDYLFNRFPTSQDIPIRAKIDTDQMRSFLTSEITARYDQDPEPFTPIPGDTFFTAGKSGLSLDVDRSIELISMALKSPSDRVINLSVKKSTSSRPSFDNLKQLLSKVIDADEFTGVVEIYVRDLQTGQDMQLAYQEGEQLTPNIAFSALSTIKIPIMIDVFRKKSEPIDDNTFTLLGSMMTLSDNYASNELLRTVLDPGLGPLLLTDTIKELGIENTFLSGFFINSANLRVITTQANSRTEPNLNYDYLDPMNQTTPTDMGSLLYDIYQCAQTGGGTFAAVYPGQISQNECRSMISLLAKDRWGIMIESGLPDGTQIAHKYGYAEDPSDLVIHNMCDDAIIYSPGGNYVLSIYASSDEQIVFDKGNQMFGDISRAVYNYFNLGS
jgi:beta-lactamase class A